MIRSFTTIWMRVALLTVVAAVSLSQERAIERDGTEAMRRRLDEIARRASHKDNPYANAIRADHFKALANVASALGDRIRYKFEAGRALLNAGRTEEAIEELTYVKNFFDARPGSVDRATHRVIRRKLAVAYMRLGEQENCAENHSAASCILPIRGDGVHRIERGSRGAVKEYLALLKDDPGDVESRWLLNIAYMTLGEYPDGVPEALLIPPEVFASGASLAPFSDVAGGAGVDAVGLSGGVAMDDFTGDGFLDIVTSSWGLRDPLRYFENRGDGTFNEKTEEAGLEGIVGGLNVKHVDYDNDGDLDLFVLRGAWLGGLGAHPNSLLENQGDGRFIDTTEAAGLLSFHPTQTAAWGDFDNDGDLDLFVGNETTEGSPHRSELFRNNGDGSFDEISAEVSIHVEAYVKGVAWGDIEGDGDLDLYVSTLAGPNLLFANSGRAAGGTSWQFEEVGKLAGVDKPHHSFPTWFFDYDNDGHLDLFACSYDLSRYSAFAENVAAFYMGMKSPAEPPRLYRNKGDGTFNDVTVAAGLAQPLFAMGSNFGDLDNDGFLDIYLGTGEPELTSIIPNRVFKNVAGTGFSDVTTVGGFGHLQKGHAVAFGDIDNDGDQDVYVVNGGAYQGDTFRNSLFENPGAESIFLTLELEGRKSNRYGVDSRIRVDVTSPAGPRSFFRTVGSGGSFGGSTLRQEIGLGTLAKIERLEIRWHGSGAVQSFNDIAVNQFYRLVEGGDLEPIAARSFDLSP